jgi:TonB-like protein
MLLLIARVASLGLVAVLGTVVSGDAPVETFVPARRVARSIPAPPPPTVVGRIEETIELAIDATGRVTDTRRLRATQTAADPVGHAVADWRFRPAMDQGHAVPSHILVAALFRPPQLYDGPAPGSPPVDLAAPSDEVPFPVATELPRYPPLAVGDAVALVEVLVGADGRVRQTRLVSATRTFDGASLDALDRWSFRPARRNGHAVQAYAYLLFGFRQPTHAARPRVPLPPAVRRESQFSEADVHDGAFHDKHGRSNADPLSTSRS